MQNDEVRRTTGQPLLSAIVQARSFSLFGHTAQMPDETDTNSFPLGELDETTGMPLYYIG